MKDSVELKIDIPAEIKLNIPKVDSLKR